MPTTLTQAEAVQHLERAWNEAERLNERASQRSPQEKKRLGLLQSVVPKLKHLAKGTLPRSTFREELVEVDTPEGANVVALGRSVLVAADQPGTQRTLERMGLRVLPVDNSELRRADSALTCMSLCFG